MSNWKETKEFIEQCTQSIWMDEPDDIKLIRWGIIQGGAGTGQQYFTCMVLLETYTLMLGQRLLYPFLMMSEKAEFSVDMLKSTTKAMICSNFHPTEFLADLGLSQMHEVGEQYFSALDSVSTKEEYAQLTGAFCTYCNRMHRWIHAIFPWNIGLGAFPQRDWAEMQRVAEIAQGKQSRQGPSGGALCTQEGRKRNQYQTAAGRAV